MNFAPLEQCVREGDRPDVLDTCARHAVALAIWHRPVPSPIAERIAALDFDAVDDVRSTIDLPTSPGDVAPALEEAGYPGDLAALLAADIAALAHCFVPRVGGDRISFRLEVVETDACRKFHADYVTHRLISTYAGPGTQWIHLSAPEAIRMVPTGAVAVLTGRLCNPEPAILHRSPPICGEGLQRLVLVLDPAPAEETCLTWDGRGHTGA